MREYCKQFPYNFDVRVIENRGRDVSALLVGCGEDLFQYDYVCFAHDKKVTQLSPQSIGDGFAYKCFENILASKEYVSNVIDLFERIRASASLCRLLRTMPAISRGTRSHGDRISPVPRLLGTAH